MESLNAYIIRYYLIIICLKEGTLSIIHTLTLLITIYYFIHNILIIKYFLLYIVHFYSYW
jgi:hypothetical protein